ncbi:MAG: hypothetical protein BroJett025_10770 [Patescibacteria group bacterium]|nr:MAG: hypothetical protein BroJett025_10770 [Patescibacteria group bacterium]
MVQDMSKLKNVLQLVLVFTVGIGSVFVVTKIVQSPFVSQVFAEEIPDVNSIENESEIEGWIQKFTNLKKLSEDATKPLEAEVESLENQIAAARNSIVRAKKEAAELALQIEEKEADLTIQYQIFSRRIAQQYKRLRTFSPLITALASKSAADLSKDLAYRESVKNQDNQFIRGIGDDIKSLQEDKTKLENNQKQLASLEILLDDQADFLKGEISKAKDYQKVLSNQIAALSARQQEIIAARSGSFTISLGSGEYGSTGKSSRAQFLNEAPSGHFAVFSFGAYSHRNGMSQYGALGRANQNQNAEQILKYYYQGITLSTVDTNHTITVNGTNTYGQVFNNEQYQFEDYLKHIYEIPPSWPKEVLKAQAIAARSFAYGKSTICPGQNCQEFKREINSSAWQEAVDETRGMIMTGGPGNWQYSSTAGGWLKNTGWDTTDGGGGSNFLDKSFEFLAGSPWVYSSWYVDVFGEWGGKGGTCGESDPWLSPEEMADIVNAHLVLTKGNSGESERVSSTSTACWGGNPYSLGELRDVAGKYGGISSASSVSVALGTGKTNSVTINGVSMSGDEFCKAYNLRAPGFLRIPQWSGSQCNGAFFNIEKK